MGRRGVASAADGTDGVGRDADARLGNRQLLPVLGRCVLSTGGDARLSVRHRGSLRNEQKVPMYHLLFFSKDGAGLTIWRNVHQIDPRGQRQLRF